MTKLAVTMLVLVTACISFPPVKGQVTTAGSGKLLSLGDIDHIAYVYIDELSTNIGRKDEPLFDLYNSRRKPESFYYEWSWAPDNCWAGSTLRESVVAYCLPYVKLGHHILDPSFKREPDFIPISPCVGIYVWYEPQKNSFYLWGTCWNFEYVLGPFIGEPLASLRRAVKPSKGRRHFPEVSLKVVSQRWIFPDERQARIPRDGHYDCAHGHPSGREIEQMRLNTFITRFRLVNDSGKDLYYRGNPSESDRSPVGYVLAKVTRRTDYDRVGSLYNFYTGSGGAFLKWHPFPRGAALEFEVTERGWRQGAEQDYVVLLNDKPISWDEIEAFGTFRSMFRSFKDESGPWP